MQFNHIFLFPSSRRLVIFLVSMLFAYSASSVSETQHVPGSTASNKDETLQTAPFITFRNKTGSHEPAEYYGGERGTISAGYCVLSSTSLSSLKPFAEKVPFYVPEDIVSLEAVREVGIKALWKELENSPNGRHPTLYTHGFNIGFEKGCVRAALFQKSYDLKGSFLYFSWPSDGSFTNYTHDEADLYWSVEPMRQALNEMVLHFEPGNINLVAHSLGTRGIVLALVMMAKVDQHDKALFNQVVLVAPDIDAGVFKQYLPLIKPLAKKITIYVSANDSPLLLSQQVHGYARLGQPGAHLDFLTGVEIIDISDFPIRSPTGHIYHLYQKVVIDDLGQLLNEDKSASQRLDLKQTAENYWNLQPLPDKK